VARVLVIEDEVLLRGVLERALVRAGHEVVLTAHGLDGLRAIESGRFDVVLVDLHMPTMDGVEFLAHLQALAPHLPVILMSGDDPGELEAALTDAKMLGARAVLPKPFSRQALDRAVASALAHGRSDSA
jgi:CheY-like chemotaxis protein